NLEVENVKRVKAVKIEPTSTGLTIVGGKNNQGKTSVLDAIAWGLGGNKYRPSQPEREGSAVPPYLHIVLSNGLIVERKGKNSDLKVIDPNGQKGGQQLLDSFVEELAIDLPKFMNATNKEKANTLLRIIGVGDKLHELETKERELYNRRHAIGQIADQKAKFAKEQPYFPEAPKEPISASDLIRQQQEILARNGENQRKRQRVAQIQAEYE
ncbi:ATP-binding protein, partial [Corallococcus exercitus]